MPILQNIDSRIDRNSFSLISRLAGLKRIFEEISLKGMINQAMTEDMNKYRKDHSTEAELKSLIGMHIYDMDSVEQLSEALKTNRGFRRAAGFFNGPPSRAQQSRDINSMDLLFLNQVFEGLFQKARDEGFYEKKDHSKAIRQLKKNRKIEQFSTGFSRCIPPYTAREYFSFLEKRLLHFNRRTGIWDEDTYGELYKF